MAARAGGRKARDPADVDLVRAFLTRLAAWAGYRNWDEFIRGVDAIPLETAKGWTASRRGAPLPEAPGLLRLLRHAGVLGPDFELPDRASITHSAEERDVLATALQAEKVTREARQAGHGKHPPGAQEQS